MHPTRSLAIAGALLAATLAAPVALAQDPPVAASPIQWVDGWDAAAKAAKTKNSVVFVYVHRTQPG